MYINTGNLFSLTNQNIISLVGLKNFLKNKVYNITDIFWWSSFKLKWCFPYYYKTFHIPLASFFNLTKFALFLGNFFGFGGKAGREPPAGSSPYARWAGESGGTSPGATQPEDEEVEAPSCRKCSLRIGSAGLPSKLPTKRATGVPRHTVLGAERKEKNRNAKLA